MKIGIYFVPSSPSIIIGLNEIGLCLKIMYVCSDVLVIYLVMKKIKTLISLFHLVRLRLSPFQTQLLQYHHHVFLMPKNSFSSSLILVGIGPLKYDTGMTSIYGFCPGTMNLTLYLFFLG